MPKTVTLRFQDDSDADTFVDYLTNKNWVVGVVNGDSEHELGTRGEPREDDMTVVMFDPVSVVSAIRRH